VTEVGESDVVIIGAGAAGLAAGAELRRLGVPARVLERAEAVGG
jgi:monoamine oxidase